MRVGQEGMGEGELKEMRGKEVEGQEGQGEV